MSSLSLRRVGRVFLTRVRVLSLTARVLVGLIAGFGIGTVISSSEMSILSWVIEVAEPVGTIFINAIRMTVVPLVVTSLIVGITSSADTHDIGLGGWRALVLFVTFALLATVLTVLVVTPLLAKISPDPSLIDSFQKATLRTSESVTETARQIPGPADWFIDLVPVNPIAAAAEGAMLPLIVFSLMFGLALSRVESAHRERILGIIRSLLRTMLALVHWVLEFAPIGVFALALSLAARTGIAAAGALAYYIALVVLLTLAFTVLVLYPTAVFLGGAPIGRFVRACAPAQAVALSSRSALASLPSMMNGAKALELSAATSGFLIPLAASLFRVGSAIGQTVGVLFAAQLYGVMPEPHQLMTIVFTIVVMSFSIPGVPAGSIVSMVPILMAAGLPVEGIGLLLGVDTIPDMFRTATNVTGGMTVTVLLDKHRAKREQAAGA